MSRKKPEVSKHATAADTSAAVDQFMASLEHPHRDAIQTMRETILGADRSVAEGIKWNAPSFRTTEYFATTHLRSKRGFGLILHLGAKARALPSGGIAIPDPEGLLQWLAKDRAMIEFADLAALAANRKALKALIKLWVQHVE